MIRLTTNFQFNSELPLDYRMNFDTIDELLAFPETDLPLGILSTVKANGTTYMFVGKDTKNGGTADGWKEVFRHGDFLVTAHGIEYVNTSSKLTATTLQEAIDEVVANFNVYTEKDSWRSAVDTPSDLPPVGKAVSGEAHVVGGNKIYVFDGIKWNDLIDSHIINLATTTSDGLMSSGDKKKVDNLKVDGDGTKFLNDKGQYLTVDATLPKEDQNKLDAINITGDGTKYFTNNGTWKTMPSNATPALDGFMSSADKVKVDMLQKTGATDDASKFLGADGTYHAVDTLSISDRERLDKVQLNQGANKFLNGEGNYVSVIADLSASDRDKIDAIHLSTTPGDEKKFLNEAGTYTPVIETIDEATTTAHGLMPAADKVKVDKLITNGDGSKLLGDDGQYHTTTGSVTEVEKAKIALLKSDGKGDQYLADDGTYKEINGKLSADDQAKLDKLIIDDKTGDKFLANDGTYKEVASLNPGGDGTKVIADDGTYKLPDEMIADATTLAHGLMSTADKEKIDKLITSGDGSKVLGDDGQYHVTTGSVTDAEKEKIALLKSDGNGDQYLADDGTYKSPVDTIDEATTTTHGLMPAADKVKVDKLTTDGDGSKVLGDDGAYHVVTGSVTDAEKAKIALLKSDGKGDQYLADDGTYKPVAALPATGDGSKVIADDGTSKLPIDMIADATTTDHGLMPAADKEKVDVLIINDQTGDKFLANDGTYKEVTSKLSVDDQAKVDKIIINGAAGEFLAADGNYKGITPYVSQVTTVDDGLMLATDKVLFNTISGIITNSGTGNLYLTDDGTYKPLTTVVPTMDSANVTYDHTTSGLTAENVQAAIDEIMGSIPKINDSATDSDTSALLSAAKIYTIAGTKAPLNHNHTVSEISDITTNYYDIPTIDRKIADVTTGIMWKESVNTYTDIPLTYPTPEVGWLVSTLDTQQIYRYNGTTWEKFGSMAIQSLVNHNADGLMSKEDKIKLDAMDENTPRIYYQATTPPLVNGNIWIEA